MEKFLRNAFSYFLPNAKLYLEASKQHEHLMRSKEPTSSTLEQLFLKEEPLHEDLIEETCEEPLIEDIVEDPHVSMEVSECPQDYFSEEDDHICTTNLPQEETISEAYSETYDEICNEHTDDSLEGLLPCDLFL